MPNEQGGMTAEEEAAWIAQRLQGSQYTPPTEERGLLAAIEQQVQNTSGDTDPRSYGIGPPYTASSADYSGPPPLDPGIWTESMGGTPEGLRYEGGVAMPVNWQDYKGNTSTGGGFFTLDELFAQGGIPAGFQSGSGFPSTNNWRLLPGGRPGFVMRNGRIININDTEGMFGPHGMGEFGGGYPYPSWKSGSGLGVPAAHAYGSVAGTIFGWPGQLDQIGYIPPGT